MNWEIFLLSHKLKVSDFFFQIVIFKSTKEIELLHAFYSIYSRLPVYNIGRSKLVQMFVEINMMSVIYLHIYKHTHLGTLKIVHHEGRKVQPCIFANKYSQIQYAGNKSLA